MFCGYTVRNDIVPSSVDGETATERSGGVHQKVAFGTDDVERRETSRNDVREHGRSESSDPVGGEGLSPGRPDRRPAATVRVVLAFDRVT